MAGSLDEMRKPDIMKYAASLGVATRKAGTKQWRQVADVRADCKLREAAHQQHSPARAGGPGSASSSQAAPRGRQVSARAASVGAGDLDSMSRADLRKLAVSLGASSRRNRATGELLRAFCKRALAGQGALARFFALRAPPQAGLVPEGGGEVGGAAPVSDSALGVAHNHTSKRRRAGAALRRTVLVSWVGKAVGSGRISR